MEPAYLNTAMETVPLLEHLFFEFLRDYDVFAPRAGANTSPPATGSLLWLLPLLL